MFRRFQNDDDDDVAHDDDDDDDTDYDDDDDVDQGLPSEEVGKELLWVNFWKLQTGVFIMKVYRWGEFRPLHQREETPETFTPQTCKKNRPSYWPLLGPHIK